MTAARIIAFVAPALALAACSQFDVRTQRDPSADFSRRRTFAWLPADEAEPADQRVNDRGIDRELRAATDAQMRAKGYVPAGTEPADILLNYRVTTSPDDALGGSRRQFTPMWGGWPEASHVYHSYDAGTLYLAALDGPTKRMIWVGAAQARLLPHISYEKRVERVHAVVEKILASFPPR